MTCKQTMAILGLVAVLGGPAGTRAEEAAVPAPPGRWTPHVSGGLDLASAYVFKGMTYNDGLVAQPWLSLSGLPLDLGIWGNYDISDYDGNVRGTALSEVDLIASRSLTLGDFKATLGYLYCTYPNVDIADDHLATLDLSYAVIDPVRLGVYGDYTMAGSGEQNRYVRPYVNYTLTVTEDLGFDFFGKVGYLDNHQHDASDGWAHYDLGAKATYKIFTAGITYIGRLDSNVLPDGVNAYDTKWVYTLGVSFEY
jgi:hypothetical protein